MKRTFEIVLIVTLVLVGLSASIMYGVRSALFEEPKIDQSKVLGIESENVNKIELPVATPIIETTNMITLTSANRIGSLVTFDNTNKKYLEGITKPNTPLTLLLDYFSKSIVTDPSGFFSIEIPKDISQFSEGQITVFDSKSNVIGGYKFNIVLSEYNDRKYFVHPEYNQIFSLKIPEDYKIKRDNSLFLSNSNCQAEFRTDISNTNFDFKENSNLIILPKDIVTLDFSKEKYIVLEIKNLDDGYTNCFNKWYDIGNSLVWEKLLQNESDKINSPISSTIKIN